MVSASRVNNISDATREISRLKQELDDTYVRYSSALHDTSSISFQGDMHKYMCIRLSGYIEQLLHVALTGFIKSGHHENLIRFSLSHFKYAPNMKPKNLEELIGKFSEEWSNQLNQFLDDQNRRDNLTNLLNIRNTTAHGGNYKGSKLQVGTYKDLIDELHNWVIQTILT